MTDVSLSFIPNRIISICEARELGLKRYFTGKECKHGHVAERITADRHCVKCVSIKNSRQRKHYYKEYMQRYAKNWVLSNPGYFNKWCSENRDARRVYSNRARKIRKSAGGKLSIDLPSKLIKLQRGKCASCTKKLDKNYHMDHIYPLARGGANENRNIQLLCPNCNRRKNAKHPIDYMQSMGYLL